MNDNNDNIWNMPELTVNEIDEFLANPMPIMEPLFLPETQMSVNELSSKIEQLTLDSSTQALRIKIERAKRQKLKMSIRALKQQLSLPCPNIATTRQEIENMQLNQSIVTDHLDREIAGINALAFRGYSRMHHLFATILPHISMPPDDHYEIMQLLQELSRNLQQFHTVYQISYV